MSKAAKKHKLLPLSAREYEAVYRVHATHVPKGGMSQLRTIADILDTMESLGDLMPGQPGDSIELYTTRAGTDVELPLTKSEEQTFVKVLNAAPETNRVWAVRVLPAVLRRLEGLEPVEVEMRAPPPHDA